MLARAIDFVKLILIMFNELLKIVKTLRRCCPWDRKQTAGSARPLLLNEVFELDEALRQGNRQAIAEELGDYFFLGLFLALILEKEKGIKLNDIFEMTIRKLKQRHPHIYGNVKVKDADEVVSNWERIKNENCRSSILEGIPVALPALQQAQLIQERCRRVGFDWRNPDQVLLKIEEEIGELKAERKKAKGKVGIRKKQIEEELGDLLFTVVNLCRHLDVNAEGALKNSSLKFRKRFQQVEKEFNRQGKKLNEILLEDMEAVWQKVKRHG